MPIGAARANVSRVPSFIPDSAIAQYDAQADTRSTGAISSIPDQYNTFDLSGSASLVSSGINGYQSYSFDGVDDGASVQFGSNKTQPTTRIIVLDNQDLTKISTPIDGYNNRVELYWSDNNSNYVAYAGGSVQGGSDAALLTAIYDGADSELRTNATTVATGDVGSNDIDGITLGYARSFGSRYFDGSIGESMTYDADLRATGDLSSEEQRIANKWDITI